MPTPPVNTPNQFGEPEHIRGLSSFALEAKNLLRLHPLTKGVMLFNAVPLIATYALTGDVSATSAVGAVTGLVTGAGFGTLNNALEDDGCPRAVPVIRASKLGLAIMFVGAAGAIAAPNIETYRFNTANPLPEMAAQGKLDKETRIVLYPTTRKVGIITVAGKSADTVVRIDGKDVVLKCSEYWKNANKYVPWKDINNQGYRNIDYLKPSEMVGDGCKDVLIYRQEQKEAFGRTAQIRNAARNAAAP